MDDESMRFGVTGFLRAIPSTKKILAQKFGSQVSAQKFGSKVLPQKFGSNVLAQKFDSKAKISS